MNQIYACREGKEVPFTDAKILSTATTQTRSLGLSVFSKLLLGVFVFLALGTLKSNAQLATWNTSSNIGNESTEPLATGTTGLTISAISKGAGLNDLALNSDYFGSSNVIQGADGLTTFAQALAQNEYYQFTITPAAGKAFSLTNLTFSWFRDAVNAFTQDGGPESMIIRSSLDAFVLDRGQVNNIAAGNTAGNTMAISGHTNITTAVTFRIYIFGADEGGPLSVDGQGGFDQPGGPGAANIVLAGTTCNVAVITTQPAVHQDVCQNSGSSMSVIASGDGLTYQWFNNNAVNSNVAGTSVGAGNGGQTATYSPSTAVPNFPGIGPYYYVVVTSTCGGSTATSNTSLFHIIANQTLSGPSGGTANQTVCVNTPISVITYTGGGSVTGIGSQSGFINGLTLLYSGGTNGSFTIQGSPTVAGSYPWSFTTVSNSGTFSPNCTPQTRTGTITVNPDATINLTSGSASQTVCAGAPITNVVYTGTPLGLITMSVCVGSLPPGVTGTFNAGTGTFTLSGSPTAAASNTVYNYTICVDGPCVDASAVGQITVRPAVDGTIFNTPSTVCAGSNGVVNIDLSGTPNFTGTFKITPIVGTGTATPSYPIRGLVAGPNIVTVNGPSSVPIAAANLTNTSNSPVTYLIEWENPTTALQDANGCLPVTPLTGSSTITVNPLPAITVTRNAPLGSPVCPGTVLSFNVAPTAGNTVPATFTWTVFDGTTTTILGSNLPYGPGPITTVTYTTPSCPYNKVLTFAFTPTAIAFPPSCPGTTVTMPTITVQDITNPVFTPFPGTLDRTVNCGDAVALAAAQALLAPATDNCTLVSNTKASGAQVPGVCPTVATITNVWTATDACGNTAMFTQIITITDVTAPVWSTSAGSLNRTVEYCVVLGANGLNAAQALVPTATDACSAVTVTKTNGIFAVGSCPTRGTITNTFIATDVCNNASTTFTQVITITDGTGPVFGATPDQTLNVGASGSGNCQVILPNYVLGTGGVLPNSPLPGITATDCAAPAAAPVNFPTPAAVVYNAGGGFNSITQSPAPGTLIIGTGGTIIPVTVIATDACGNSTTRIFNVTLLDQTAPIIRCRNIIVNLSAAGTVQVVPSQIDGNVTGFNGNGPGSPGVLIPSSDNCSPVTLTFQAPNNLPNTSTLRNYNCSNTVTALPGTNPVVLVATDASGNSSTCAATITVVDNIPPAMNCAAITTTTLFKSAAVNSCLVTLPDFTTTFGLASDICGILSITQSPVAGTILAANQTSVVVTFTATDVNGNVSTCTRTFALVDNTPPVVLTCPANQTLSSGPASCSITATWALPTFADNCSPVNGNGAPFIFSATATGTTTLPILTTSQTSATFFTGVTTVTYVIRDQQGNSSTCVFTVTVNDNTNPIIVCPSIPNCSGGGCNPTAVTNVILTINNPGAPPPTIIVSGIRIAATTCSYTLPAGFTAWNATATDNCLLANPTPLAYAIRRPNAPDAFAANPTTVIATGTSLGGQIFQLGISEVTWTATDFSGNISICRLYVEVVDNQLPSLTCPATVNINTNTSGCRAQVSSTLTTPTASDNCAIVLTEWDVSGVTPVASGTGNLPNNFLFSVGLSTVQYRVTDAAGNFRTCSFNVIVTNAVDATIGTDAVVGQNIATTSTITFTGSGAGTVPPAQVQYTFLYSISTNGNPAVVQPSITTGLGSSVTTVAQSNAVIGTYRYFLISVTDQNGCVKTFAPQPSALITVVAGTPDLTFEIQAFNTLSIAAGGTIQQVLGIKNQGTAPTSGPIVFTVSNYTAISGLTAVSNNNASVTIGFVNYTLTNATDWVVTQPGGVGTPLFFTSALTIVPGQTKYVGVTINRVAGTNGTVTSTGTITSGTGGGETPTNNNSITNTITKN